MPYTPTDRVVCEHVCHSSRPTGRVPNAAAWSIDSGSAGTAPEQGHDLGQPGTGPVVLHGVGVSTVDGLDDHDEHEVQAVQAAAGPLGPGQLVVPVAAQERRPVAERGQLGGGETGLDQRVTVERAFVVDDADDGAVADHDVAVPQIPLDVARVDHLVQTAGVLGQHATHGVVVPAQVDPAAFAVGQHVRNHAGEHHPP